LVLFFLLFLVQAQHLLRRLHSRQLYVYIDEVLVDPEARPNFQPPTPQDLVNLQESDGTVSISEGFRPAGADVAPSLLHLFNSSHDDSGSSPMLPWS
jgi:hypothetical protein